MLSSRGHDLELMSKLPNNDIKQAAAGKIYLSSDGSYVVRDLKEEVQQGSLKGSNIDLSDLGKRLNDQALKNRILEITSKAGYTRARYDTACFWRCNKDHTFYGGVLYTKQRAENALASGTDEYEYILVTLTDEQLGKLDRSNIRNENKSLEQFNPFSPKVIKYKQQIEIFKTQKFIFAQGLGSSLEDSKKPAEQKNKSPLKTILAKNSIFDRNVVKELFSFLEPADPFKRVHDIVPKAMIISLPPEIELSSHQIEMLKKLNRNS